MLFASLQALLAERQYSWSGGAMAGVESIVVRRIPGKTAFVPVINGISRERIQEVGTSCYLEPAGS